MKGEIYNPNFPEDAAIFERRERKGPFYSVYMKLRTTSITVSLKELGDGFGSPRGSSRS